MADDLDTVLTTLARLQRDNSSAIELYRAGYAVPNDVEGIRFWVQGELDRIQSGFSSADEVITILASAIQAVITATDSETGESALKGEKGDKGDPGQDGQDGVGNQVYIQNTQPNPSNEGDIWIKTAASDPATMSALNRRR
jgi:hypothetical protein